MIEEKNNCRVSDHSSEHQHSSNAKTTSVGVVERLQPEDDDGSDQSSDGGLSAWMTLVGVWLIQFGNFGYTNAYGVFNDFYVRDYLSHFTSSQISWIGSVQFMFCLSAGIITGRAFDAGYCYHLTILGSLLFIFCLFMLSLAKPQQFDQIFLSQGIGLALAIGLTYVPSVGIIAHHFKKRRAFALGIATSGSAVGGVIHPILINKLIYGPLGFSGTVKVSAGMNAAILVVALLMMRTRYQKRRPDDQEAVGLWKNMTYFYSDLPYLFASAGTVLVLLGLYFLIFFLQLFAVQHGIDSNIAFYSLTMLNGANAFGRVLPNMLVPMIGLFNVIIPTTLITSALIFSLAGIIGTGGMVAFALLYGFFSGAYVGLLAPLLSSLALKPSEIGARMGICFFFAGLSALVGSPIAGALLGLNLKWINPIIFSGVCVALGCASFLIARFLLSRRKASWKI